MTSLQGFVSVGLAYLARPTRSEGAVPAASSVGDEWCTLAVSLQGVGRSALSTSVTSLPAYRSTFYALTLQSETVK